MTRVEIAILIVFAVGILFGWVLCRAAALGRRDRRTRARRAPPRPGRR
jgi:uncharacterized membrane protein YciS (DUF1049 family)